MPTEIPDYTPPDLNAEEACIWGQLSKPARKALMELDSCISPPAAASRLWERTLVAADRQRLGGDLEAAWCAKGTLRMWMEVRGLTNRFVAVAEIGSRLNLLTPDDYQWLLRETGCTVTGPSEAAPRPQWDAATGRLMYDGQLIRRVRILKSPSHVQRILDGFHDDGWSSTIGNPLDKPHDQQKLHLAVHQLNRTLEKIRFSARGGAQFLSWEPVD